MTEENSELQPIRFYPVPFSAHLPLTRRLVMMCEDKRIMCEDKRMVLEEKKMMCEDKRMMYEDKRMMF